jgi:hypothetical protein
LVRDEQSFPFTHLRLPTSVWDDQSFPLTHLEASRSDAKLQAKQGERPARLLDQAHPCPVCGTAPDELAWFWFCSPFETWEMLCGRAGWVSFCDRDERQVDFFLEEMN